MLRFRCIAMPTAAARRFREGGLDGRGNRIVARVVETETGGPCRHCLRYGRPGETMLLGSYDLPRPLGIYWTPSPIFVHAADCPRFEEENRVAPSATGAGSIVSVRAYDQAQMCLYDLGRVCDGTEVEAPLLRALSDARTSFVNIHTARPGCWLAGAELL